MQQEKPSGVVGRIRTLLTDKRHLTVLYVCLLIAALLLYGIGSYAGISCRASFADREQITDNNPSDDAARLAAILSEMRGVGKTDVMLAYERAPDTLRQSVPIGVLIVAEGASDVTVRLQLMRAAQAATGVALTKIEVFEMDGDTYHTND